MDNIHFIRSPYLERSLLNMKYTDCFHPTNALPSVGYMYSFSSFWEKRQV